MPKHYILMKVKLNKEFIDNTIVTTLTRMLRDKVNSSYFKFARGTLPQGVQLPNAPSIYLSMLFPSHAHNKLLFKNSGSTKRYTEWVGYHYYVVHAPLKYKDFVVSVVPSSTSEASTLNELKGNNHLQVVALFTDADIDESGLRTKSFLDKMAK